MEDDQFTVLDLSPAALSKFARECDLFQFKKNQNLMEKMIERYLGNEQELAECRKRIEFLEQKLKKKRKTK